MWSISFGTALSLRPKRDGPRVHGLGRAVGGSETALRYRGTLAQWWLGPPGPDRQVRQGLVLLCFAAVTGVLGYVLLCGWSLGQAIYMLLITVSTVGYGEIGPRTSWDRVVTSYVILVGITAAAYTFGGILQLMSEGRIRRIVSGQLQASAIADLRDHHIICGYGRMGSMICEDLKRSRLPYVLIELDKEKAAGADHAGHLVIQGDATDEATLLVARIGVARSLVCVLPSDADNVYVTLTGRNMNKGLFITARAERSTTEKKLKQAGADRVVSPQVIGASRITNLLTRPTTIEILELVAGRQSVDLEMNEVLLADDASILGQTLAQVDAQNRAGVMIVGVKRKDGNLIVHPDPQTKIHPSDTLVILGKPAAVDRFRADFAVG